MFTLTMILHFAIAGGFTHEWRVTQHELSGAETCDERSNAILKYADRRIGRWGTVTAEVMCARSDGRRA